MVMITMMMTTIGKTLMMKMMYSMMSRRNISPNWKRFLYYRCVVAGFCSLRFQAGGRRKRPNLGLVCCV